MLKLTDLRKTTRRSGADGLRVVYPRFLRDATLAPRIEMAIRYMERMLGQPRRALDDEVIVQLFGDHKVARCLVACLGAHYRHRPRSLGEVLPPEQVASLAAQGITNASELRLWLFRRVNRELAGFAGGEDRASFLAAAGHELGLDAEMLDKLIALDAPEQAILVRTGSRPAAEDIIARYNYAVTTALLAQASLVRVNLTHALSPRDTASVLTLAGRLGVSVELGGRELVLHGRQDALESWTRHGGKLARLLALLVMGGMAARSGEALVTAPQGGQWLFRMDGETFGFLGATTTPQLDLAALCAGFDLTERLLADATTVRRAGDLDGWSLRRMNEPMAASGRLSLALGQFIRGDTRVALLPIGTQSGEGLFAELAHLTEVTPAVIVAVDELPNNGRESLLTNALRYEGRHDMLRLPAMLDHAIANVERRASSARFDALCDEAASTGVLTEPALAHRIGCAEEDIAERLAEKTARMSFQRRGLEYVEGFGLCTREMLAQVRRAASEIGELRENPQVGNAWMMRTLGRKLREVTGAHEGIECLIAWLGAA